jgi:hypothetical protein
MERHKSKLRRLTQEDIIAQKQRAKSAPAVQKAAASQKPPTSAATIAARAERHRPLLLGKREALPAKHEGSDPAAPPAPPVRRETVPVREHERAEHKAEAKPEPEHKHHSETKHGKHEPERKHHSETKHGKHEPAASTSHKGHGRKHDED